MPGRSKRILTILIACSAVLCLSRWVDAQAQNARDKVKQKLIERAKTQRGDRKPTPPTPTRNTPRAAARPGDAANPLAAAILPREIDTLLENELAKSDRELAPITNDHDFLRRVYVDLTGKPPTPDKVDAFQNDPDPEKRSKTIDQLLATEDYARNWARYWRDVIAYRALDRRSQLAARQFEPWLTEQLHKNVHWDRIASEIITAKGPVDEDGRTFLIFAQFDGAPENTAVNVASEVSRVFLGIQIQCAQCHDHPYDEWKREQFHEMAAFFARTNVRRQAQGEPRFEVIATDDRGAGFPALKARRLPPEHQMPDKDDPEKKLTMHPRFLLGQKPREGLGDADRRATFAQYLTDTSDPWFARAFVNRIWGELMGEGFYEPIDDLGPGREARFPMIINRLASAWRASDYDVKWLFRLIMNTDAYQREIRPTNPSAAAMPFAAVCPTRLSGDQIYDSLVNALGIDESGLARAMAAAGPQGRRLGPTGPRAAFNAQFGIDPSTPSDEVQGTIPQALFMMNSALVNSQIQARGDTILGRLLAVYDNDEELIQLLYHRVLARPPRDAELSTCLEYIREVKNREEAFEDLLWSLVNSTEFITKR